VHASDLARRFGALYTGALTDILDELGHRTQTLPSAITALAPGMRLAGPAFCVEGRPQSGLDYDASIRRILELLGAVPPGHVVVYATGDRESAQFGELSATSLAARGVAGVVLDGGCRDVDFIVRERFPVFCRYTTPLDAVLRWEVTEWGHEVEIGGVRVQTGDYVVGDADGVVVVPATVRDEVLQRAEALANTEDEVRTAVRDGMTPLDAYDRYGKF
jgi:regulator of RNase E activity RraA